MFELSENIEIKKDLIQNSCIYIIDNFYKNPDEILKFFLETNPHFHKKDEYPSFNSIYFEDKRHYIRSNEISKVYKFLSSICSQSPLVNEKEVVSNVIKFKKNIFNDYVNNYWWPHTDSGYTAIIYLNKNDYFSGTNLYDVLNSNEEPPNCSEHYAPWRPKKNFKLLYSIKPKFNRMVLFDGYNFVHGMNICNDDYFNEKYRMNQVMFFQDPNYIDD